MRAGKSLRLAAAYTGSALSKGRKAGQSRPGTASTTASAWAASRQSGARAQPAIAPPSAASGHEYPSRRRATLRQPLRQRVSAHHQQRKQMPGTVHGQRHLRALALHRQMKRIQGWRGTARHGIQGQGWAHWRLTPAQPPPRAPAGQSPRWRHRPARADIARAPVRLGVVPRQFGVGVHFPGRFNALAQHLASIRQRPLAGNNTATRGAGPAGALRARLGHGLRHGRIQQNGRQRRVQRRHIIQIGAIVRAGGRRGRHPCCQQPSAQYPQPKEPVVAYPTLSDCRRRPGVSGERHIICGGHADWERSRHQPARALAVLARADLICAEDTRVTGQLLTRYGIQSKLVSVREHNERAMADKVCNWLAEGQLVAQVSDAGTPAVSDPGARLVAAVRAAGHPVCAIPGACAAVTALAASGVTTAEWLFHGFCRPSAARVASSWKAGAMHIMPWCCTKRRTGWPNAPPTSPPRWANPAW